ncbi:MULTISPECIES: M28 family peptidase [Nostocales]|uniref:Aminopeptidase n=3 Tax=Nostocales TaxID=1161 RepID=A0A0C1N6W8_9CYAN|nr:M28 family peptidase [Tolypothrix bouteillei]KAF3885813.1 M28 family peptidase [Tolypothrix bouteillei VB521301]
MIAFNNIQKKPWLKIALMGALIWLPTACGVRSNSVGEIIVSPSVAQTTNSNRTLADVEALVNLGPRVAGTPVMEKASSYLVDEYRKAGYVTEVQTFTYSKFQDNGSNLTINGETIKGIALNGTIPGNLNAPLIAVPNFGRKADFAAVNVTGAIAIVQRGEIRFSEKAKNALAAGAVGLVIVNNKSGDVYGSLAEEVKIPVLAISREKGDRILQQVQRVAQNASLKVDAQKRNVTGRNVIAHLEGVTQPKILLGAHYDSVAGSPGANDNASGTAVLLSLARNMSKTQTARQAWFVAFDGEEDGLQGARAFVKTAKPQFLSDLKAMMNFDMVGVNNQLGIGGSSSLTKFAQKMKPGIKIFGSSDGSDHAAFASKNVPILFFYRGQEPNYHTPNDKKVNPKLLDETTQAGLDIIQQILNATTSN